MGAVFNALVWNKRLNIDDCKIWRQETREIILCYGAKHISIFWTVEVLIRSVQTDGQKTDSTSIFSGYL